MNTFISDGDLFTAYRICHFLVSCIILSQKNNIKTVFTTCKKVKRCRFIVLYHIQCTSDKSFQFAKYLHDILNRLQVKRCRHKTGKCRCMSVSKLWLAECLPLLSLCCNNQSEWNQTHVGVLDASHFTMAITHVHIFIYVQV